MRRITKLSSTAATIGGTTSENSGTTKIGISIPLFVVVERVGRCYARVSLDAHANDASASSSLEVFRCSRIFLLMRQEDSACPTRSGFAVARGEHLHLVDPRGFFA